MATTKNYLGLADHLNIYDSDHNRVDANIYTTSWQALNATVRVTDNPAAIMDIDYYTLEIMPTNPGKVTLYINDVVIPSFMMLREMIFHCQVKCATDVDTTTSLLESGQPMGMMLPNTKKTTRDQFVTVRSNIWVLPRNQPDKTVTVEIDFENHEGNIIYLTIPAIIDHLDFYKNSVVRSARTVIPDAYWRLDFEQSDPQFPMYKLLDALTNTSNDVMQLFSNWFDHELDELAPGLTGEETWAQSTLTDPSLADQGNMDWLAQFTGAELKGNIAGTDQPAGTARDFYTTSTEIEAFLRWQLENSYYGRGSGTREAMISAVQRVLTGDKSVAIIPHHGAHAWKIQVQTLRSETQDFDSTNYSSDDVLDAVAQAAPMGYEIFHMAVLFFAFTLGNVGLGRLGLGVLGGPGGYVPPDAPTGLTISAGGTPSTELTLTWVAPAYNGGDAVSAYLIRRDGSIIVANTGNTNVTYTDTGRLPGTSYSYTVAAINGAGAGDQSSSASGTTDPIVADAPTSLTAAAGSTPSSMIDLSWTAPAYTGGAPIVGYRITENRAGAGDVVIVGNTGSIATTYTRTGLDRVVSYTYKVAAINSAGIGANSNTATLTTAAELPGAPTGLTLTAASTTTINLSWIAPVDNGGAAISGYRIKKDGSTIVANTGNTNTTYSATGLTINTVYTFEVAAINSAGAGGDSNEPSEPTYPGTPTSLSLSAGGDPYTQINLSWTAPTAGGSATITGYLVQYSTNGSSWSNVTSDTGSSATTYTATSLTANTEYWFRVAAINAGGTGSVGNEPSLTTSDFVTVTATTGSPTIRTFGNTKSYEFGNTGSITFGVAGNVDAFCVAGGGAGGSYGGGNAANGGGGGGGCKAASIAVTTGQKTVTVGPGGAAVTSGRGSNGSPSSFETLSTTGGGGGDGYVNGMEGPGNGGSGGGGGAASSTSAGGMRNVGGTGIANEGNDGGNGAFQDFSPYYNVAGGGGGAGGQGYSGSGNSLGVTGGNGGSGVTNDYATGSSQTYGGGGGAGAGYHQTGTVAFGSGGSGGGGDGRGDATGDDGTDGLGGGGGAVRGNFGTASGKGGDGVVIIQIRYQ
tara:strand:- start:54 stop:3299 length:3246 start_codon:yes stop_codon:yes gene_type:complete